MKPVILWTCDVKTWAYWVRIETMSVVLPEYDHRVLIGDAVPPSLWQDLGQCADCIICQGIAWPKRLVAMGMDPKKMILRLDSVRVNDPQGNYINVFDKPVP